MKVIRNSEDNITVDKLIEELDKDGGIVVWARPEGQFMFLQRDMFDAKMWYWAMLYCDTFYRSTLGVGEKQLLRKLILENIDDIYFFRHQREFVEWIKEQYVM